MASFELFPTGNAEIENLSYYFIIIQMIYLFVCLFLVWMRSVKNLHSDAASTNDVGNQTTLEVIILNIFLSYITLKRTTDDLWWRNVT